MPVIQMKSFRNKIDLLFVPTSKQLNLGIVAAHETKSSISFCLNYSNGALSLLLCVQQHDIFNFRAKYSKRMAVARAKALHDGTSHTVAMQPYYARTKW